MQTALATAQPSPPVGPVPTSSSTKWSTSVDAGDTGLVTLPPGFLEALREVVPRRRRAKLPYVVGLGLLTVIGVLGADRSTREFLATRLHRAPTEAPTTTALGQVAEPATALSISTPTATTAEPVEHPLAPALSSTANGPGTIATPKKTHPRRVAPGKGKTTSSRAAHDETVRGF